MTKLLGIMLILSSVIALLAGAIVGQVVDSGKPQITGNLLSNIMEQPSVSMGFFDYLQAVVFSYSIISLIMGLIFLIRI